MLSTKTFLFNIITTSSIILLSHLNAYCWQPLTPLADHYEQIPTFLAQNESPSTMVILDSSGSMCVRAHDPDRSANESPASFTPTQQYSGIFEPLEYYSYNATALRFEIGTNTADWSGNWLNWMTARRMDGAKKALTGGQTFENVINGDSDVVYEGHYDCSSYADDLYAWFNNAHYPVDINGLTRPHTPLGNVNLRYTLDTTASAGYLGVNYALTYTLRVLAAPSSYDATTGPTGLIQQTADRMRFGLTVFGDGADGGKVTNYVGSSSTAIVNGINNTGAPTSTPLAETLHTVIGYFQKDNTDSGGTGPYYRTNSYLNFGTASSANQNLWDAFYFDATKPSVFCSELNVLLITDGEPTSDSSISTTLRNAGVTEGTPWNSTGNNNQYLDNVAFWAHTTDLRTDLQFTQNMNLYTVMAFGQGLNILRNAAINGSFIDHNGDGRPNNLTEECAAADDMREWDFDGDGCAQSPIVAQPDHYLIAEDSDALALALAQAFSDILKRMSVGSASSVMSTSRTGEGTALQATYLPYMEDNSSPPRKINWLGDIHTFFTDDSGNIRLDSNHNNTLDCDVDKAALIFYDGATQASKVRLFTDSNGNCKLDKGEDLDLDGHLDVHEDQNNNAGLDLFETDMDGDGIVDPNEDFDGDNHFDLVNEDVDSDCHLDVDEDTIIVNGLLDTGEDVDGDGNLDVAEDLDGDSHLDNGEDIDCDGHLDVAEDSNGNGILDADEAGSYTEELLMHTDFLWSAVESLASISNTDLVTQGSYNLDNSWDGQRYILSGFDSDGDGSVSNSEAKGFFYDPTDSDSITSIAEIRRYLRVEDLDGDSVLDTNEDLNGNSTLDRPGLTVEKLINYTRGLETTGLRSRLIGMDPEGDGVDNYTRNWILGDVINSAPIDINVPAENFDLLYKSESYRLFAKKNLLRRHVIYAGGNDGMLHAFNGGFYNKTERKFYTSMVWEGAGDPNGNGVIDRILTDNGPELGAELWAYIPYNALPHLVWLSDLTYDHIPFVDAPVRVADVKIFQEEAACSTDISHPDCVHPSGWGTILIAGMGFGGGPIAVDSDSSGTLTNADRILSSSFSVFDITNPEKAPILLEEFSFQNSLTSSSEFSFTTSFPSIVQMRRGGQGSENIDWYLVFGSGPTSLKGQSTQQGKVYIMYLGHDSSGTAFDVASGTALGSWVNNGTDKFFSEIATQDSFISDIMSTDFEVGRDDDAFKDDAIYFGSVAGGFDEDLDDDGTADTADYDSDGVVDQGWSGDLYRIAIDDDPNAGNWVMSTLMNVGRPITTAPVVSLDDNDNTWIYTGTGRYFDDIDSIDDYSPSNVYAADWIIGVMEPGGLNKTWATVPFANLVTVSDAKVYENASPNSASVDLNGDGSIDTTFGSLLSSVNTGGGWKYQFSESPVERSKRVGL